jgi:hypothetical protein
MAYTYDPSRSALLRPAQGTVFFPAGRPLTEAALCAEMARLAYAPFEREEEARTTLQGSLQRVGFPTCQLFSTGGTQAFLAEDRTSGLSILVFRGTELDPRDWATDLNALPASWPEGGLVHEGFAAALRVIWPALAPALSQVAGRLLYTGHSLGAALATLAASRHAPQAIYTFGSPRVGDMAFVQTLSALPHHRFTNCCDVVCRVPPEAFSYRHVGPASYLDRRGVLHVEPPGAIVERDQKRARRAYFWRWAWRPGTLWTRDLADHAPVNYLAAVTQLSRTAP